MKKKILLATNLILLLNISISAQMRQSGNRQNFSKPPQKNQALNIEKMTQFEFYDDSHIIKVLKIKEAHKKLALITDLETYNNKLIEIKAFNIDLINTANKYFKSRMVEFKRVEDPEIMDETRLKLKKMLAPIHDKLVEQKLLLNQKFQKKLTSKEYKKWLNYQRSKNRRKLNQGHNNDNSMKNHGQRKGQNRQNYQY